MPESPPLLPHIAPSGSARLLLFAVRRIAAGGLRDAFAAHALIGGFGLGFRRPLVLLRAFMAEVSRVSAATIHVAPCCCARMTEAEAALVESITLATAEPARAHARLARLLGVRECLGLLTSAQAVAGAFADAGLALERTERLAETD